MVRYLRLLERSVNGEKGGILIYSNNHNFFPTFLRLLFNQTKEISEDPGTGNIYDLHSRTYRSWWRQQ